MRKTIFLLFLLLSNAGLAGNTWNGIPFEQFTSTGNTDGEWLEVKNTMGSWLDGTFHPSHSQYILLHQDSQFALNKIWLNTLYYNLGKDIYAKEFNVGEPKEITGKVDGQRISEFYREVTPLPKEGNNATLGLLDFTHFPYVYAYDREAWLFATLYNGVIWFYDFSLDDWVSLRA